MDDIYQAYAKTIYAYLLLRVSDHHIAEELTQETFFQAVKSIQSFRNECSIETWLVGIAKNVLKQYYKKQKHFEDIDEIQIASDIDIEKNLVLQDERQQLLTAIHLLTEPYKEVTYLRVYTDLSFKQIGTLFNKSENWARITYYRAKQQLIKEIQKDGK